MQLNTNNWQQRNHTAPNIQYQHHLLLNAPKSASSPTELLNSNVSYSQSGFSNNTFETRSPITTHNQVLVNAYHPYQVPPFCYPPTPPKDALLGNMAVTPTAQKLDTMTKSDKLVKVESVLSPDSSENESRNVNKEMSEDERQQRKFYNDSLEDDIDNEQTDEDDDEFDNKSNLSIDEDCNDDNDDTCSMKSSKEYYDWNITNKINSNEWQKSYMGKSELDTSNTKTNGSSKKKAIPG